MSLKFDNNNGYFTWRRFQIYDNISLNSSYNENVFDKSSRENRNTRFIFCDFFSENHAVCEILSKNMMQPEKPQITLQYGAYEFHATQTKLHARTCRHTPKRQGPRTHAYTQKYVLIIAFPRQQWSRTRLIVTFYVHCLSCVYLPLDIKTQMLCASLTYWNLFKHIFAVDSAHIYQFDRFISYQYASNYDNFVTSHSYSELLLGSKESQVNKQHLVAMRD